MKPLTTVKYLISTLVCVLTLSVANPVYAEDLTADVSMATILDNPTLREAMAKHVPDLMGNPEIDQARVISLSELATYVPDQLTDKVIAAIVADLNAAMK